MTLMARFVFHWSFTFLTLSMNLLSMQQIGEFELVLRCTDVYL